MDNFGRNLIISGIVLVVFAIGIVFYSSCKSASMYNWLNNANFTCSDFFWASEQINSQSQTIKIKQ